MDCRCDDLLDVPSEGGDSLLRNEHRGRQDRQVVGRCAARRGRAGPRGFAAGPEGGGLGSEELACEIDEGDDLIFALLCKVLYLVLFDCLDRLVEGVQGGSGGGWLGWLNLR